MAAEQELTTRDLAAADAGDAAGTRPEPDAAEIDGGQEDLASSSSSTATAPSTQSATAGDTDTREPLLPPDQSERFTVRWQEIQASFVDEPQQSVEQADALVADLMQRLAATFSAEREELEAQWAKGDDVSTENLRVALKRYRSFFDRLLAA
jgi:hypothetical protein